MFNYTVPAGFWSLVIKCFTKCIEPGVGTVNMSNLKSNRSI